MWDGKWRCRAPDGGVSFPSFLKMGVMRDSTSLSTYLWGGWVDMESVDGALDVCDWECGIDQLTRGRWVGVMMRT